MAQSLELLLIQFLMPDNDARRQAEEQIRRLARDPQVVPALVHHLRTAKTPNVRQLAAVLLRKKITSHWPKLPRHGKASLKEALIDSITLDHRAVGSFIEYVNDGGDIVKMFREFVPSILNVSRQCLANGEEDVASIAFEIFDELIESPAPLLETANEDEDSDLAADRSAAEVIDTMAVNLPRHVIGPVLEFASVSFHHANPKYREAAVSSLGVISEGCCEHLKDKLEECLKIVLEALQDQEQMVRGAASFALGQFAEHLQPEILSHYASVLPCILNALEDPSDEVKEKSYYALAAFCEDMGEDILPYLDPLMCRLVMSLQSSPRNLQETCMSAIGSVAAAAEQAFIPYAEKVLEMMKGFMVLTNDEDLCARARATEVVGIVAMAVGRARIEEILPPFIEAAISGFGLDYSELREYTHGFFSNIAEILGDSFTQYLPHVVPLVFSSCNLDDGSAIDIDDADSVDNGLVVFHLMMMLTMNQELEISVYLEESLKILIRHNILTAIKAIPPTHADIIEKQKDVLDTVINIYTKTMTEDDDKEVVAQACMSLSDIVKDCGITAIEPYISRLAEATLVLLRQESSCQQIESDGEDDGDIDHDEVLMDAVSDLLPAFAKVMGSYFDPIFAKLFDPLMKFAKSPHPPQDKTMVVATLAEVAQEMGAPISAYVDRIMPLVLKEIASSDATNRRNAAFCAGEICKNGGAAALNYYGDILRALHPLFSNSESDDAVRDNAAGAIARMIMVQPQSMPLNQVLPVFIKALPLKEDHEESMTVYSCICNLLLSSHPQILPLVPDVVHVFAQVVVSPDESDEIKTNIGRAVSHLVSVYGCEIH
ncbi:hypothetical protein PR202_ga26309 [Eleusine coracana subsp. coracana]|uniref:Importin N-terminal domain-containing protein n=1 Tax=Eleusine coracana subsp. coracana TaxID=191504 RepID=A0AAV5DDS4_ELECO|nr:hypothetical protein PR202_ga26309 [Eleusine coracana subsp. coracana]